MSEKQLRHNPTPWIGRREPGQDILEILFSTMQESWGIHLYSQVADCYEPVFSILKEMEDKHLEAMSTILEWEHDEYNEVRVFNTIESFHELDELLVHELKLRSKLLSVLNKLVSDGFQEHFDWEHVANALDYVSRIHSALVQRLSFLRGMMEGNRTEGKAAGSICPNEAA